MLLRWTVFLQRRSVCLCRGGESSRCAERRPLVLKRGIDYSIRSSGYCSNELLSVSAGVATAFAAPIGGLLLAIEEGSSFLSLSLFWRGFLATCTGVTTLHVLAQIHGNASQVMFRKFGLWRDLG